MSYTVEINGVPELVNGLQWVKNNIDSTSEDLLDDAAQRVQIDLKNNAPASTGELKDSIDVLEAPPGERLIGAGRGRLGSKFPPEHYIAYVEHGGGPRGTRLPNVDDISLRFGVSMDTAWAIAKKIRDTGTAVRPPSMFVRRTANAFEGAFKTLTERWVDRIVAISRF